MKRTSITLVAVGLALGLVAAAATTTIAIAGPVAGRIAERMGGPDGYFRPGGPGFEALLDSPMVRGRMEKFARFWDDEELVAELGLTQSQIVLLEQSYTDTKAALEANRDAAKAAREALRTEMEKDSPDPAAVDAAIDAVAATHTVIAKEMLGQRVVVKNLLTPEQEDILEAHRRENGRKNLEEGRAKMEAFRTLVKSLAADGDISDADWTQIETALEDAPEPVRDHAMERLRKLDAMLESGDYTAEDIERLTTPPPPPPPHPDFGPGGPGFGPPPDDAPLPRLRQRGGNKTS